MNRERRPSRHKNTPFEDAIEEIGRKAVSIISSKANDLAPKIARKISAIEKLLARKDKRH
jgi:hypothetical protein